MTKSDYASFVKFVLSGSNTAGISHAIEMWDKSIEYRKANPYPDRVVQNLALKRLELQREVEVVSLYMVEHVREKTEDLQYGV